MADSRIWYHSCQGIFRGVGAGVDGSVHQCAADPGGAPHARRGGVAVDPADPRIRHDVCSPELVGGDLRRNAGTAVPDAGGRLRAGPVSERAAAEGSDAQRYRGGDRPALVSGGEYFANLWSDAGDSSRAILQALVTGEPPPEDRAARTWLREHDVVNDAGEFLVPMVARWVKEKSELSVGAKP